MTCSPLVVLHPAAVGSPNSCTEDEMAANSSVVAGLRSSLSFSEYGEQEHSELFHNLEKLIASAVSICRLDGSLQCQIGGLITVIEELQRLLRHNFTEIKRLERTVDYQKQTFSATVSDLHKQMRNIQANAAKCVASDAHLSSNNVDHNVGKDKHLVSLVDESYGNGEESDSSIPYNVNGQPDVPEESNAAIHSSYGDLINRQQVDEENNQPQVDEKNNQLQVDEENNQLQVDEENNQLQVDEENNQLQIDEENNQLQVDEENNQLQVDEENNQPQVDEASCLQQHEVNSSQEESGGPDQVDVAAHNSYYEESAGSPQQVAEEVNMHETLEPEALGDHAAESKEPESIDVPLMESFDTSEKTTQTVSLVEEEVPAMPSARGKTERMLRRLKDGISNVVPRRQSRSLSVNPRLSSKVNFGRPSMDIGKSKNKGQKDSHGKLSPRSTSQISRKSSLKKNYKQDVQKGIHSTNIEEKKHSNADWKPRQASMEKPIDRNINLDFLLMVNQLMSDLVMDSSREEATLDQVKESDRNDVVKLAKMYRLRVRFIGKTEEELPVMLVKGRDSCLPKPGEVDVLLSSMSVIKKQTGQKHKLESSIEDDKPTNDSKKKKV